MELKAGRELDALVAEKVMGWRRLEGSTLGYWGDGFQKIPRDALPAYSSSIADAWTVVEKLKQDKNHIGFWLSDEYGDHCCPDDGADYPWFAAFCLGRGVESSGADTPSHAICLAALKAVANEKT